MLSLVRAAVIVVAQGVAPVCLWTTVVGLFLQLMGGAVGSPFSLWFRAHEQDRTVAEPSSCHCPVWAVPQPTNPGEKGGEDTPR